MNWNPSSVAYNFPLKSSKFDTLWTPRVHHLIHNSPQLVTSVGQVNSVHATPCYFRLCLCLSSSSLLSIP
jgi:hypothetical protein